jgi:hypothetical protein
MDRAAPARQARNPGRFTRNQVLNFKLKKDFDYYTKGAEKLDGDIYDGTNLPMFLKMFQAKAHQFNWTGLLTYLFPGNPRSRKNL